MLEISSLSTLCGMADCQYCPVGSFCSEESGVYFCYQKTLASKFKPLPIFLILLVIIVIASTLVAVGYYAYHRWMKKYRHTDASTDEQIGDQEDKKSVEIESLI
ncbi:hypothetical protein GCK72_002924 [Caenorhabditis remanei]|uniref:Uncharacterized protein n=1 Tax=Caenorhabditis remanei TaxID=31234 RepID=A0A6A5HTN8_CAERE|nr:hypothetical protein GCK72_002924 [Caenorhabditis remanei]KAF1771099.1 hypothetical protein GCK72_002924 [Caenorhabditis remanei]